MTRTITSDEVRCPKCYSPIWSEYGDGEIEMSICAECGCMYITKTKEVVTCTEVPND